MGLRAASTVRFQAVEGRNQSGATASRESRASNEARGATSLPQRPRQAADSKSASVLGKHRLHSTKPARLFGFGLCWVTTARLVMCACVLRTASAALGVVDGTDVGAVPD